MCRSIMVSLFMFACSCRSVTREDRKPRVEVVFVVTAGDIVAPAEVAAVWKREAERCIAPKCELVRLVIGGVVDEQVAPDAWVSSARSASAFVVASNLPDRHLRTTIARGGIEFEVLGVVAESDENSETLLRRLAEGVFARGAHATIAISERCADELVQATERNGRSWPFLLLAVGKACGASTASRHQFATLISAVDDTRAGYSRVSLVFDRNTRALLRATDEFVLLDAAQ